MVTVHKRDALDHSLSDAECLSFSSFNTRYRAKATSLMSLEPASIFPHVRKRVDKISWPAISHNGREIGYNA